LLAGSSNRGGRRQAGWDERVVDDHLVELDAGGLVLLGDLSASSEEESVSKLHDVGLVDAGDFLWIANVTKREDVSTGEQRPGRARCISLDMTSIGRSAYLSSVLEGEVKGEPGDSLGSLSGGDLERLHDTREGLVLETRVLSLSVLSDDGEVDVVVSGLEAGEGLADDDRGVDVERLAHRNVPRVVLSGSHGGREDTWRKPDNIVS
jgi:hypothetical protein